MKTTKSNLFRILFSGLAITTLFLVSCSDADDTIDIPEIESASVEDINYTDEVFDEVTDLGDEAMDLYESNNSDLKSGELFSYSRLSECVTVSKDSTDNGIIVTIDFGEENCEGNDGRDRRGKIIATHIGNYWDGYAEISFAFVDFFVDDNQVIGEKSIIRTMSSDSLRVETITADGAIIFADSSGTFTRVAEHVRTTIEGSDTRKKRDDVVERIGESTCTLIDGTVITTTIIEPLVRMNEQGCAMFFVSGIIQIIKGDESPLTVDYGDGTCDNLAEITQDGVTEVIELGSHRHRNH